MQRREFFPFPLREVGRNAKTGIFPLPVSGRGQGLGRSSPHPPPPRLTPAMPWFIIKRMRSSPWYKKYEEISFNVSQKKLKFKDRCKELGSFPDLVTREIWNELIAKAVHESNWQEGLRLGEPRTEELANEAFDDLTKIAGPHLDMKGILEYQRKKVLELKKTSASEEEIGAYNLSIAYHAIQFIGHDITNRVVAALVKWQVDFSKRVEKKKEKASPEDLEKSEEGLSAVKELMKSSIGLGYPSTEGVKTLGEYIDLYLKTNLSGLPKKMNVDYIHFLHKVTMMGILASHKSGNFRKLPVHIGVDSIQFPPASLVPGLMEQFSSSFPPIVWKLTNYDAILKAAEASYRFVAIHPYSDGNGRVARLLMNLILWGQEYPPVYLKADKKGRHRYAYALKQANRGKLESLASLIAMSLEEIYDRLLRAVNP